MYAKPQLWWVAHSFQQHGVRALRPRVWHQVGISSP